MKYLKLLLAINLLLVCVMTAQADLMLNPATGEYVVVRDANTAELKLNPTGEGNYESYTIEDEDSELELNSSTIEFEYQE